MPNTTANQNNEPTEANELLQETKPTQMVVPLKAMVPTWTIVFPFLEEELQLNQIYGLYPNLETNPSVETKTGV